VVRHKLDEDRACLGWLLFRTEISGSR
jgi:hypothetical protein